MQLHLSINCHLGAVALIVIKVQMHRSSSRCRCIRASIVIYMRHHLLSKCSCIGCHQGAVALIVIKVQMHRWSSWCGCTRPLGAVVLNVIWVRLHLSWCSCISCRRGKAATETRISTAGICLELKEARQIIHFCFSAFLYLTGQSGNDWTWLTVNSLNTAW